NTPPAWQTFQWPNPGGVPGAKLVAVTGDGRTVELANAPGGNGVARLIGMARQEDRDDSSTLTWVKGDVSVSVLMRMISRPGSASGGGGWQRGRQLPATVAGAADATEAAADDAGAEADDMEDAA